MNVERIGLNKLKIVEKWRVNPILALSLRFCAVCDKINKTAVYRKKSHERVFNG